MVTLMHSLAHDILSAPVTAVAKHHLPQLKDMYEVDSLNDIVNADIVGPFRPDKVRYDHFF